MLDLLGVEVSITDEVADRLLEADSRWPMRASRKDVIGGA